MSQVAIIVLKVIDEKLRRKVENIVDKAQLGFLKGKGTMTLQQIKNWEYQEGY